MIFNQMRYEGNLIVRVKLKLMRIIAEASTLTAAQVELAEMEVVYLQVSRHLIERGHLFNGPISSKSDTQC